MQVLQVVMSSLAHVFWIRFPWLVSGYKSIFFLGPSDRPTVYFSVDLPHNKKEEDWGRILRFERPKIWKEEIVVKRF
jgi:hypothetical protein